MKTVVRINLHAAALILCLAGAFPLRLAGQVCGAWAAPAVKTWKGSFTATATNQLGTNLQGSAVIVNETVSSDVILAAGSSQFSDPCNWLAQSPQSFSNGSGSINDTIVENTSCGPLTYTDIGSGGNLTISGGAGLVLTGSTFTFTALQPTLAGVTTTTSGCGVTSSHVFPVEIGPAGNYPVFPLPSGGPQTLNGSTTFQAVAYGGGASVMWNLTLKLTPCIFSIAPTSQNFPSSGGTGSVAVTASDPGCPWTAVSTVPWVTITSGASGTGNGTVAYSVAPNTGPQRNGVLNIAGEVFTVNQGGTVACSYSLSANSASFPAAAGSGSVNVITPGVCPWTAVSNTPWLAIASGSSGNGGGTVAYTVAANPGTTQRVGTLTIAGLTYTVTQAGTGPAISLVANAEGESPSVAPNTWVEIKGVNLAPAGDTRVWQGSDFVSNQMPTQLDGVSATVNGKAAYVYYISPAQVNILTPPDAMQGPVQVQLTSNGVISAPMTVQAQSPSPSLFVFNGGPYVAAEHTDGSLLGPPSLYPGSTTPAKPGETVVLYANGFGPTDVPVVGGSVIQSGTLSPLPVIKIGGINATVSFAGLIAPGEFQFNVIVPALLADGDQPVTALYSGSSTQAGTLTLTPVEKEDTRALDFGNRGNTMFARLLRMQRQLNRHQHPGSAFFAVIVP